MYRELQNTHIYLQLFYKYSIEKNNTPEEDQIEQAPPWGSIQRYGSYVYKTEKRYDNDLDGKFIIFNWAFPKNLNSAMILADKISKSFKGDMKKEGMASWGMATRIIPQNSDLAPLFFWDAYENMDAELMVELSSDTLKFHPSDLSVQR